MLLSRSFTFKSPSDWNNITSLLKSITSFLSSDQIYFHTYPQVVYVFDIVLFNIAVGLSEQYFCELVTGWVGWAMGAVEVGELGLFHLLCIIAMYFLCYFLYLCWDSLKNRMLYLKGATLKLK